MRTALQILDCRLWAPGLAEADGEAAARTLAERFSEPEFGLADPALTPTAAIGAAEAKAPAAGVPPMLRRRLSPLGRACAETLWAIRDPETGRNPFLAPEDAARTAVIFASRWGDIEEAARQVRDVAADRPLSPARFATSVHNGIAAVLTIAAGFHGNVLAIANGPFSLSAAFDSAVGLLTEVERVIVVAYDLKPPVEFDLPGSTHALAFLCARAEDDPNPARMAALLARGPVVAQRSRALRPGEVPDPRFAEPGAPSDDLATLAWLMTPGAAARIRTVFGRHAALVWAKDSALECVNGWRLRAKPDAKRSAS